MAWVEKIERNGKTSYRYCDRVTINGKEKRVTVSMAKDTKKERDRAVLELQEKCRQLEHPEQNRDMYELLELYLKNKDCRESTRAAAKSGIKKVLKVLEGVPLNSGAINRALLESDISKKTLKQHIERYKPFLKWLCKMGYLPDDFAPYIPLISVGYKEEKKSDAEMYLEPEELEKVLSNMSGMYYYITKFLALTGCRIGEAIALRLEDVDEKYIHITKTESHFGVTAPKTQAGKRDVYIQPELAELLKEYKEWRNLYLMSRGIRTDRLFFTMHGNAITRDGMCRVFQKLEKKLPDLGKHLHPHIFRHTHVAILAAEGMSLDAIARRVGHERSDITRRVYLHVTNKQKAKDEEVMSGIRICDNKSKAV